MSPLRLVQGRGSHAEADQTDPGLLPQCYCDERMSDGDNYANYAELCLDVLIRFVHNCVRYSDPYYSCGIVHCKVKVKGEACQQNVAS
jgi:hypothetical protein